MKNLKALLVISALLSAGVAQAAGHAGAPMTKDAAGKDTAKKEEMKKDDMKKDAMAKDGMKKDEAKK